MKPTKTQNKKVRKGTALITGASQRLGKEMAIYFAQNNYNIVIHYNNSKKLASDLSEFLQEKFQVQTATIKGDLNKAESAKKIADFMNNNFQDWNILINNASIFNKSKFLKNIDDE
ncbi:MAG: SDR family NAD(P)-dependent oxidoreductase, partial [Alphaproteobacteria bacterium]